MKYVRGYVVRMHGPFLAKEKFEGFVKEVFEHEDHYIIQGVRLDKEQIEHVAEVSVKSESLDMPALVGAVKRKRTRKAKQKEIVKDEHDERFEFIKGKWSGVLAEALKDAKRYKRMVSPIMLELHDEAIKDIEESMRFATVAESPSQKYDCCERLFSQFVSTIYEVDKSPTEKQMVKQFAKTFGS
ncbi:hypothetical protein pVa21_008 [Vibrio phage pVa-21]|nr:hypothetical protein pVa21_008 [Vibrio phage pVa-21]